MSDQDHTQPPRSGAPALTYRAAGVDADRGDALVERIGKLARLTERPGLVAGIGGFASLFSLRDALATGPSQASADLGDPLLVSGTDGVGTKLKVAFLTGKHDTIGIDLVAMCVNDVITCGARPLFFLDYFATGALELDVAEAVIRGIAEGCRAAECALVGGETAEMPGLYAPGEYDLAGFAVGVVDRSRLIDGKLVRPGDRVVAIRSHGLHSNGYSLARKALLERGGLALDARPPELRRTVAEELLEPTAIYVKLLRLLGGALKPKAIAHITGAGIPGNLPRVLPAGVKAVIDRRSWKPHPIFRLIQETGGVEDGEMFATFNMGVGLMVVVSPADEQAALRAADAAGEVAFVAGEIAAAGDPGREAFVELTG